MSDVRDFMRRHNATAEIVTGRNNQRERVNKKNREDFADDLIDILDEEIDDHLKYKLDTYGSCYHRRRLREIVLRHLVKTTMAGMNLEHFSGAEGDPEQEPDPFEHDLENAHWVTCPECEGSGFIDGHVCRICEGTTRVERE